MMRAALILAGAAVLSLTPAAAAAPPARDWSRTVVATPEGGFRMGNPKARVKLIEYGSLTCPHCRHFAETSGTALVSKYVRTGKVSYEYRNMVLNGIDVAATLVARCGGPRSFFPMVSQLYATQTTWVGRLNGLSEAQKQEIAALPDDQRLSRIAELGGFLQLGAKHGIAPAAAKRCLADKAAFDRLGKIYEGANALGVEGTPTFFVNGKMTRVDDWRDLEPQLK